MVDDLLTISECGFEIKKLQFGTSKCIKMHIGKSEILCKDLHVGEWKNEMIDDPVTAMNISMEI